MMEKYPEIIWDFGTAYDFFVSLLVLHKPADFGLSSSWAAGMRQRLPARDRELLEMFRFGLVITPPLTWLSSLPQPKNGETLLKVAKQLPALDRFYALSGADDGNDQERDLIQKVAAQGTWYESDRDELVSVYKGLGKKKPTKQLTDKLDIWAKGEELGEKILSALQTYHDVFFAEEEHRIFAPLQAGLAQAKEYYQQHNFLEFFEKISNGVRYSDEQFDGISQITLAPSYWASPFLFYSLKKPIFLFGARPETASLIPGELVPDALTTSLSALSNPTRLRILRYLSSESLTPTQLATRLRLRTPTVIHHLKTLRMSGLVVVITTNHKKEVYYQTRVERLTEAWEMLSQFVAQKEQTQI